MVDNWGYYTRYCTSWVAWALHDRNGFEMPNILPDGNAANWGAWAQSHGYTVDSNPVPGAVAWWGANAYGKSAYGHVAWVSAVNGDQVMVEEYNNPSGGLHGTSIFQKSQVSGYIHFKDLSSSGSSAASGPGTRLLGDVNGDNRDDAVVMFRDTGTAMVALSNGNGFSQPTSWAFQHTVGADKYFLADVEGDNRADLIAFWTSTGRWRVNLSSGSGFWPEADWAYGHGVGTSRQWVADVNGDQRADVVTVDLGTGDWWVSLSSGTGFWSPTRWRTGHGIGSTSQNVADFTGDGKADAAVWVASNGSWWVSPANANGTGFYGSSQWSYEHGLSSDKRFVGDTNGDNRADTAYFFASNGHWDAGMSSGSGFWAPTAWAHGHGVGTHEQFLSDVNGDNRADVVTFDRVNGDWWVSLSSGTGFWSPARWATGHGANS